MHLGRLPLPAIGTVGLGPLMGFAMERRAGAEGRGSRRRWRRCRAAAGRRPWRAADPPRAAAPAGARPCNGVTTDSQVSMYSAADLCRVGTARSIRATQESLESVAAEAVDVIDTRNCIGRRDNVAVL